MACKRLTHMIYESRRMYPICTIPNGTIMAVLYDQKDSSYQAMGLSIVPFRTGVTYNTMPNPLPDDVVETFTAFEEVNGV